MAAPCRDCTIQIDIYLICNVECISTVIMLVQSGLYVEYLLTVYEFITTCTLIVLPSILFPFLLNFDSIIH
jgi:hypothetical protein